MLICIECSGIHREMGVHYSRIQSLDLDVLGSSELLVGLPAPALRARARAWVCVCMQGTCVVFRVLRSSWRRTWEMPASTRSRRRIWRCTAWPSRMPAATCECAPPVTRPAPARARACHSAVCPWPPRQARKDFITAKYTEKRFTRRLSPDAASRRQLLYEAVRKRDVLSLIQVYFEGLDLMDTCPQPNEHV